MKVCKKCGVEKELTEFQKHKSGKFGVKSCCKLCVSEKNKMYYLENKEKIDQRNKKYNKNNKEKINEYLKKYLIENEEIKKEYRKKYNEINSEKIKSNSKKWKENNKEYLKKKNKEYREDNKEQEKLRSKNYVKNNRDKYNRYHKKWKEKKRISDPLYYLIQIIRNLVSASIRDNGYDKKSKTYQILGCSFDEFKLYLESKFESWMNWGNHGNYVGEYNKTWHLDHIKPVSLAKSEEEIYKLNHYTNFQPLCSKKNLEKSNKLI